MADRWRSGAEFLSIGFSEREAVRLRALMGGSSDPLAKAVCRLIDGEVRDRERERRSYYKPLPIKGSVLTRHGNDEGAVAKIVKGTAPVYELTGTPKRWRRATVESLTRGEFYMYQPCDEARSFVLNGTRYEMRISLPPHTYRYEPVAEA